MALRVVTPPSDYLLTVDAVRPHLGLEPDETDWDALIAVQIAAAQAQVEAVTQRRFMPQTLEWVRESWDARMVLPVAPGGDVSKLSIDCVSYYDTAGVQQILDPATMYWSRPVGATLAVVRQRFAIYPWIGDGPEPVVIRFSITSTAADASPGVLAAMKLLVGHFFLHREAVVGVENRDSSTPLPLGVDDLLRPEQWTTC